MNAGVGLISFPNSTLGVNEDHYKNDSVISKQIINLVKAESDENDNVSCPWVEIGQEPISMAYREVKIDLKRKLFTFELFIF